MRVRIALAGAAFVLAVALPSGAGELPTCFGREATILGSSESGSQSGETDQHNVMMGFAGEDELYGANLADYICGGTGDDPAIVGYQGGDRLSGNSGNDTLRGGAGRDRILGRRGDDTITGGAGVDYIDGGIGNDVCVGDPEDTIINCEA